MANSRPWNIRTPPPVKSVEITATDHIKSKLDIPPILPQDQTAEILRRVLKERGFEEGKGEGSGLLHRDNGGVHTEIDPNTGGISISSSETEGIDLPPPSGGCPCAERAREAIKEAHIDKGRKKLQARVTERLEREVEDTSCELEGVANQVTSSALKKKAQQLGQIKKITQNEETGEMTILVEVGT